MSIKVTAHIQKEPRQDPRTQQDYSVAALSLFGSTSLSMNKIMRPCRRFKEG